VGDPGGATIAILAMLVLFVVIGIAVKLFDLKHKREEEGLALQARVTDALLVDPTTGQLPITATVQAPLSRGAPMRIVVSGYAPTAQHKETALALVRREAESSGVRFEIEDHLAVEPEAQRAA